MIEKTEIIQYLDRQESDILFYKNHIAELEAKIELMKTLDVSWISPDTLKLESDTYSSEAIQTAFMKAKVYEGLKTNEFTTVLDTFIKFLDGTHHSLKKKVNE